MAHGNELLKTKYYFLKLPKGWFKNARIKKLRKIAGGDTYTIIYLKIMLLSIQYNSTIIYEGLESTIEEELALKIDEDIENVRFTIAYLQNCGLWQEEDGDYILPEVKTMIGSETYGNVMRREKKLGLANCKPNANQMLTNKDKEIDKELDNRFGDKDIDTTNIKSLNIEERIKLRDSLLRALSIATSDEDRNRINQELDELFTKEEIQQLGGTYYGDINIS